MESFNGILVASTVLAALGCGLVAGVFFAFSSFVMKALSQVPSQVGIRVMQTINVTVLTPWFMGVFFGTGIVCAGMLVDSLADWEQAGSALRLAGSALYLVGSIGVTIVFNVPRNKRLAVMSFEDPKSVAGWVSYLSCWTAWNHVRTAASFVAAGLFCLAVI
jgi:uncharacterized membrane protein